MVKIEIYSTAVCPYCVNAKILLQQKGADYEEIRVDADPSQWESMLARSNGERTVPQIFINDRHIGGFDNLAALNAAGELDSLLKN